MRHALMVALLLLGLTIGAGAASWGTAQTPPPALAPIFDALTEADTEIRESIMPAYSGVLTAIVLIGVAGAIVAVVTRSR
jgi:hypothetical protein